MAPLDRLEERYRNDQAFRTVVDILQSVILKAELTPSEVRDAAHYAAFLVELKYPKPLYMRLQYEADTLAYLARQIDPKRRFDGEP